MDDGRKKAAAESAASPAPVRSAHSRRSPGFNPFWPSRPLVDLKEAIEEIRHAERVLPERRETFLEAERIEGAHQVFP